MTIITEFVSNNHDWKDHFFFVNDASVEANGISILRLDGVGKRLIYFLRIRRACASPETYSMEVHPFGPRLPRSGFVTLLLSTILGFSRTCRSRKCRSQAWMGSSRVKFERRGKGQGPTNKNMLSLMMTWPTGRVLS
ncbi:hypothetical protein YC2023_010601 [Brassica napus]